MRITFNVVKASLTVEPPQEYFMALSTAAAHALAHTVLNTTQAWALCEYLDAVDGSDMPMDRELYRRCVSRLGTFLADHSEDAAARKLANKSWAANTLLEMLEQYTPAPLRRAA